MANILCDSPVIIFNEAFKKAFLHNKFYFQEGKKIVPLSFNMEKYYLEFPYYLFSKKHYSITKDNLDYIYTVGVDGDIVPAWIQVPCGKCLICKHKKAKEWSFRAVCETQTSDTVPLFVTLTYNNNNLPSDGVSKLDIQLFMKRLRIYFDRHGLTNNLRYFCCAEYGSNTSRAHYHLLLWNFPISDDALSAGIPLDIFADRIIRPIWDKGFVYVRRSDFGSVFYVMKYMKKGVQAPFGLNPGFFLSSRRHGGIGALFLDQVKDYYLSNPHVVKMTVTDKYTGRVFESYLPKYFREKLYPSPSKAVHSNVISALKILNYSCLVRKAVSDILWSRSQRLEILGDVINDGINHSIRVYSSSELQVFCKFESIFPFHEYLTPPPLAYLSAFHYSVSIDLNVLFKQYIQICDILTDYLNDVLFSNESYISLSDKKAVFMNRLSLEMSDYELKADDIDFMVRKLDKELKLSILKEVI